jgi:putative Mg2+ transporter-C (MgtC) family protein
MQTLSVADFALRLAVGVGCGALIGLERQWRARLAGLRTNALVAGGATLFVLYAVATEDSSPTRVAHMWCRGSGFSAEG